MKSIDMAKGKDEKWWVGNRLELVKIAYNDYDVSPRLHLLEADTLGRGDPWLKGDGGVVLVG